MLLLGCMFLVFASLFCPALSGSCFSSFFGVFRYFFALGAGRRAVFFSPFSFFVFVCFSFIFWFFFVVGACSFCFSWACFGAPGGSKKGFLLAFFGGVRCSCCGSFFGLVFGGASKKGFLLFFFAFFWGGVFFLWVPFWACFGAPGGL